MQTNTIESSNLAESLHKSFPKFEMKRVLPILVLFYNKDGSSTSHSKVLRVTSTVIFEQQKGFSTVEIKFKYFVLT